MAEVKYYYERGKIYCEVLTTDGQDETTEWMDITEMEDITKEMKRKQKQSIKEKTNPKYDPSLDRDLPF